MFDPCAIVRRCVLLVAALCCGLAPPAHAKPIGTVDGVAIEPEWAKAPWPTERRELEAFAKKADGVMMQHYWRAMAISAGVPASTVDACMAIPVSGEMGPAYIARVLQEQRMVSQVGDTPSPKPARVADGLHWIELSYHGTKNDEKLEEQRFRTIDAHLAALQRDGVIRFFSPTYLARLHLPCVGWEAHKGHGTASYFGDPTAKLGTVRAESYGNFVGLARLRIVTAVCKAGRCERLKGFRFEALQALVDRNAMLAQRSKASRAAEVALAKEVLERVKLDDSLGFLTRYSLSLDSLFSQVYGDPTRYSLCLSGTCLSVERLMPSRSPDRVGSDSQSMAGLMWPLVQQVWMQGCIARGDCAMEAMPATWRERYVQYGARMSPKIRVAPSEVEALATSRAQSGVDSLGAHPAVPCLQKAMFLVDKAHPSFLCRPNVLYGRLAQAKPSDRQAMVQGCSAESASPEMLTSWRCESPELGLDIGGQASGFGWSSEAAISRGRDGDVLEWLGEHRENRDRPQAPRTMPDAVLAACRFLREDRTNEREAGKLESTRCREAGAQWCFQTEACAQDMMAYWARNDDAMHPIFDVTLGEKVVSDPTALYALAREAQSPEGIEAELKLKLLLGMMRAVTSPTPRLQQALQSLDDATLSYAIPH